MKVMVTGGAGFIGSAVVRHLLHTTEDHVLTVDKLTYAATKETLKEPLQNERHRFEQVDICDRQELERVFKEHCPDAVLNLAAETHVDRSIVGPAAFIQTNLVGTYTVLETARAYWEGLPPNRQDVFRFLHVSTDEVYGELADETVPSFTESTSYKPNSPYSATKAGADMLVRAWNRTYGFPALITNCSNNYGPYQFPEKLIPHMILCALQGEKMPLYGEGKQIRDWLFVEDHARALYQVLTKGKPGQTYNIGAQCEKRNVDIVQGICALLEELAPERKQGFARYENLITRVTDRPGHDYRYAINADKIKTELGWVPQESFDTGLRKTVKWYLDNEAWWQGVLSGAYKLERIAATVKSQPPAQL